MSSEYFDKYRFESNPTLLRAVAEALGALIPDNTQALAGLELGGIPLVTVLSQVTNLPAVFVRKQAKRYGTERLAEGAEVTGQRLVVIEDVLTTCGQVLDSVAALRELGATIGHVVCVVDREAGAAGMLAAAGLQLRALFRYRDLASDQSAPATGAA
jgi:orotate phosphoribosyltransferase